MNNLVQQLMTDHRDWDVILECDYKIKITRDGWVASLRYDQIESPMHEPIVQQCRGMVVDTVRRRVIAWPYNKFWNLGETLAAPVDWATARVQEKLDGSLMILYWRDAYDGWCVASSGHPTAGGSFGSDERTFRDAFWQVARGIARPTRASPTCSSCATLPTASWSVTMSRAWFCTGHGFSTAERSCHRPRW